MKEELVGAAKKRGWNRSGAGGGGGGGEGFGEERKRGWEGGVRELEECHNSLQIGEADVQSLTWPCTVPFEVWREGVCARYNAHRRFLFHHLSLYFVRY